MPFVSRSNRHGSTSATRSVISGTWRQTADWIPQLLLSRCQTGVCCNFPGALSTSKAPCFLNFRLALAREDIRGGRGLILRQPASSWAETASKVRPLDYLHEWNRMRYAAAPL